MRLIRIAALATLPWLLACSREQARGAAPPPARSAAAAPASAAADTGGKVYSDSTQAMAILFRVRTLAPTGGNGFDPAHAPKINPEAVLAFVSDSGLTLDDVNAGDSASVSLSRDELRAQLAGRHGRGFVSLVHLAHIYSQPYPQYSQLSFSRGPEGFRVAVADWYRLVFVRERGHLRLRRVSYVNHEGE